MSGVRVIGTAERKAAVLSFTVDGVHPHDVGTLLNEEGVAIRTGHHCAQPVMQRFKVPATCSRLLRFLQHVVRGRCAGRRDPESAEGVCVNTAVTSDQFCEHGRDERSVWVNTAVTCDQ